MLCSYITCLKVFCYKTFAKLLPWHKPMKPYETNTYVYIHIICTYVYYNKKKELTKWMMKGIKDSNSHGKQINLVSRFVSTVFEVIPSVLLEKARNIGKENTEKLFTLQLRILRSSPK